MGKNLEGILETGVYSDLNENSEKVDFVKKFSKDVDKYLKNKGKEEELPFVNQEKTFKQISRVFSSQYPYVVLVGEPGIGKSMILNYVSDVLTGKKSLEDLEKVSPETVPLFKKIIKKVNNYERLNYLCLPNFQDPLNVNLLPYPDEDKMYDENHIAACFCDDVAEYVNDFLGDYPEKIKLSFNEKNLNSFFKNNIHKLYQQMNNVANDIVFDKCKEYKNSIISLIDLKLNGDFGNYRIEADWNLKIKPDVEQAAINSLKEVAGFKKERINITLEELEKGLSNTIIPSQFPTKFERLILDVHQSELKDSDKEPSEIFESCFKDYKKQISELKNKYNTGKIKTQQDLLNELKKKDFSFNSTIYIADSTLDSINGELSQILKDYRNETKASDDLLTWMESVVGFFKNNHNVVKNSLTEQYAALRQFEDDCFKKKFGEDKDDDSKNKNLDNKKDGDKKKNDPGLDFQFELKHGKHIMSIHDILETNYVVCDSTTEEGITCNKIGSIDEEILFGSFSKSSEQTPPHMTVNYLGNFFKGGILLFQDSFGDFIKTIISSEGNKKGMREQFLEYLQTGTMSLVNSNGITYHIKAPKIILGCCNEDPFIRTDGPFIKDEPGLRSRIKIIDVPSVTLNTKESRQGSLKVLYGAIDEFNKSHSSNLELDSEVASLLLNLNVNSISGYVDLKYREFVQSLDDLCAYAISQNKRKITSKLIKDKVKETLPLTHFSHVDYERRAGNYFTLPDKTVGHICGLSTAGDRPGSLIHVNSQFIPGFEKVFGNLKRFKMVDSESEMTDETTFKGYELVKDFVQMILGKAGLDQELMNKKGNWKMKTHYGGNWDKVGGPSASMATTISVVSALTGDPIYKNRFITGTIDSMTGECGVIGGTYLKSLIPYRLKEISEKLNGGEENMYFLFPVGNRPDLERDILFDPFGVKDNITFLPVNNFVQAYLLSTCGDKIDKKTWESSLNQEKKIMDNIYSKIKNKFK